MTRFGGGSRQRGGQPVERRRLAVGRQKRATVARQPLGFSQMQIRDDHRALGRPEKRAIGARHEIGAMKGKDVVFHGA
jgi:hypothetical protein